MNSKEIYKLIDDGANFYCRQLGNASHMEYVRKDCYSMIYPKTGEDGGTSIFDITIEHLNNEEAMAKINEIKAYNAHTWWSLCISNRIADLVWGKDRPILTAKQLEESDELCMAVLPDERLKDNKRQEGVEIKPVTKLAEFEVWADICNLVLHNELPIIHPINHYDICKNGIMNCYIGYYYGKPVSVAAILNNDRISSLEFVATLNEHRRLGLATALSQKAVEEAFMNGVEIVTTRAFADAKNIYKALGFKCYFNV
jgi:ribosomal protein S18 acetylase RimI-like enzyme